MTFQCLDVKNTMRAFRKMLNEKNPFRHELCRKQNKSEWVTFMTSKTFMALIATGVC